MGNPHLYHQPGRESISLISFAGLARMSHPLLSRDVAMTSTGDARARFFEGLYEDIPAKNDLVRNEAGVAIAATAEPACSQSNTQGAEGENSQWKGAEGGAEGERITQAKPPPRPPLPPFL